MWKYELHPLHLINVATLPCEIRNSEHVGLILRWDITKNYIKFKSIVSASRNRPVGYKMWGVMQQRMYETKICDIRDLQKAWRNLGLTLNRTLSRMRLTSCATVRDHVWMLVADTLNTRCEILVHLYYVVGLRQNIFWNCQCNMMHLNLRAIS